MRCVVGRCSALARGRAVPASPVAPSKQCFVVLLVQSKLGYVVVGVVVWVAGVVAHFVLFASDVIGFVVGLVVGPA